MAARSCASWAEPDASSARPVPRAAITSEWSPKIDIGWRRRGTARLRKQLRRGVHERGKRKGQPLDAESRNLLNARMGEWRRALTEHEARIDAQRALLADPFALVRAQTGCQRAAEGAR